MSIPMFVILNVVLLPNGYQVDKSDNRKFLHLMKLNVLQNASLSWVSKIRITGGEPTVVIFLI